MFKFWTYLQLQGLSYLSTAGRKVVARENNINEQDVWLWTYHTKQEEQPS